MASNKHPLYLSGFPAACIAAAKSLLRIIVKNSSNAYLMSRSWAA
jgi:hypothetical protein